MKKSIKETQLQEVEVITDGQIICDCCEKIIVQKSTLELGKHYGWFHLCTGHRDWGNDSVDSIEYFDLCSRECLANKLREMLDEYEESDTAYFETKKEGFTYYGGNVYDRFFR